MLFLNYYLPLFRMSLESVEFAPYSKLHSLFLRNWPLGAAGKLELSSITISGSLLKRNRVWRWEFRKGCYTARMYSHFCAPKTIQSFSCSAVSWNIQVALKIKIWKRNAFYPLFVVKQYTDKQQQRIFCTRINLIT